MTPSKTPTSVPTALPSSIPTKVLLIFSDFYIEVEDYPERYAGRYLQSDVKNGADVFTALTNENWTLSWDGSAWVFEDSTAVLSPLRQHDATSPSDISLNTILETTWDYLSDPPVFGLNCVQGECPTDGMSYTFLLRKESY